MNLFKRFRPFWMDNRPATPSAPAVPPLCHYAQEVIKALRRDGWYKVREFIPGGKYRNSRTEFVYKNNSYPDTIPFTVALAIIRNRLDKTQKILVYIPEVHEYVFQQHEQDAIRVELERIDGGIVEKERKQHQDWKNKQKAELQAKLDSLFPNEKPTIPVPTEHYP